MTEFAINSSVNKSTGFVPFELTYGYILQMTLSVPTSEFKGVHKITQRAIDNLQAAHDAIIMSHVKQTMQSNKSQSPKPMISEGDLVYLSTKELSLPKGQAKKLLPLFIRPYKVIKAHPESSTYTIKLPPELEAQGIHPISMYQGLQLTSQMIYFYFLEGMPKCIMTLVKILKRNYKFMKS